MILVVLSSNILIFSNIKVRIIGIEDNKKLYYMILIMKYKP
ncbi:hypothetical protein [Clostridium nigeriense]|nr:hypothetical protein [Clostridium nigeriense]